MTGGNLIERLMSVDIVHPFFAAAGEDEGLCPDLGIWPTPATLARLAPLGLRWRRRTGGGDILGPGALLEKADAAARAGDALPGTTGRIRSAAIPPLTFGMFILDPNILNLTALEPGFGTGRRTLCLSNRWSRPDARGHAVIQPDAARSLEASWAEAAEARRRNAHTAEEREPPRLKDAPDWWRSPEAQLFLDEAIGHLDNWRGRRLPFALLELHVHRPADGTPCGPDAAFPLRLAGAGAGDPAAAPGVARVHYRIPFAARETRWRYVIADREGRLDLESLAIAPRGASRPLFLAEAAPARPVPGARAAVTFLSAETIPLRRTGAASFRLTGRSADSQRTRTLVDALPTPGADQLPLGTAGSPGSISEMFVFV
jgi:hypothetical protein